MEEVKQAIAARNQQLLEQQYTMIGATPINNDVLEKAAAAQEGEIRTWNGKKFRKQGKQWVPVTAQKKTAPQNGKSKPQSSVQPVANGKKSAPAQQPQPQIASQDLAHLKRVKVALASGDMAAAAEIANGLPDEAKNVIPPAEWEKIHEHTTKASQTKDEQGNKKQSVVKQVAKDHVEKVKSFVSKNKELFDTGEHAHPERSKLAKFLRGKAKGLVKGLKHEIHHIKDAGVALKKVLSGDHKNMSDSEKKALKKVGISLGLTIGTMVATGGISAFAHGVGSFFHHLGVHFVEHAFLETAGKAAIFAKGQQDELGDDSGEHFEISDEEATDNKSADNDLEMLIHQFIDYIENGDWSELPDQINAESDEDDDPKQPISKKSTPSNDLKKALEIIDGLNLIKADSFKLQGQIKYQGLTIKVENRKGGVRKGVDRDGKEWKTKMLYPYGYISRTKATDGEHVDCYVGDDRDSDKVFVIHQNHPDTGKYDEDKVMLGFNDAKSAKQAYLQHYNSNKFFGSMTEMTFERFKESLKENHGKKLEKAVFAVRVQRSRAINTINALIIDLFKGGKKAAIGEVRTFGGREYIKTIDGWKFHGKGGGTKAKEHVKSSGGEQTPESKAHEAFKDISDAKGCKDTADCEINIQHVFKLLIHANKNELGEDFINKLKGRLSELNNRRTELENKSTKSDDKQEKIISNKQWLKDNKLTKKLMIEDVDTATEVMGSLESILTDETEDFYDSLHYKIEDGEIDQLEMEAVLSTRFQYRHGVNVLGDWNNTTRLNALQKIEELCDTLPIGFIKNNNELEAFHSDGEDEIEYAYYTHGHIYLSDEVLEKGSRIFGQQYFQQVVLHELGHSISAKTGESAVSDNTTEAKGNYLKFAELCGWDKKGASIQATDNEEDVPRINDTPLLTNYAQVSTEEAFAEYFSAYATNKDLVDKALKDNEVGVKLHYMKSRPLTEQDLRIFSHIKRTIFENDDLIKAIDMHLMEAINVIDLKKAFTIVEDVLEKGGKPAFIGEIRKFGGREYVKTLDGWKFHGKGTGTKAKDHVQGTKQPKQETQEIIATTTLGRDKYELQKFTSKYGDKPFYTVLVNGNPDPKSKSKIVLSDETKQFFKLDEDEKEKSQPKFTISRVASGFYKGSYKGINFQISNYNEGTKDVWWGWGYKTAAGVTEPNDQHSTKAKCIEEMKYVLDHPELYGIHAKNPSNTTNQEKLQEAGKIVEQTVAQNKSKETVVSSKEKSGLPEKEKEMETTKTTQIQKWYKTGVPSIDGLLTKAEPFLDKLIDKYHETRETDIKHWAKADKENREKVFGNNEPKPIDAREEEYIRLAVTYDLAKSLSKNIKEGDVVSNIEFRTGKAGVIQISAIVNRDNKDHGYHTDMIYAGGYNIQKLHYRYITKTSLPKNSDTSIVDKIKKEMSKMKAEDSIKKEIGYKEIVKKRYEKELEEKSAITRKQADRKHHDFFYERFKTGPKFEYLNDQAKEYYKTEEAYNKNIQDEADRNWDNLQHQVKKYLPHYIKDIEKTIEKQKEKLKALKGE